MVCLTLFKGKRAQVPGRRRTLVPVVRALNHAVFEHGYWSAKPYCLHPAKFPRHLDLCPHHVAVSHVLFRPAKSMMVREQGFRQWREKENTLLGLIRNVHQVHCTPAERDVRDGTRTPPKSVETFDRRVMKSFEASRKSLEITSGHAV